MAKKGVWPYRLEAARVAAGLVAGALVFALAFALAFALVFALVFAPQPADARNLLESLFELFVPRLPKPATPILPEAADDPPPKPPLSIVITPRSPLSIPGTSGYCVRLCDGRYFPLPRLSAEETPEKICNALCPSSRTTVFWGSSIQWARAASGLRYDALETAFDYRKKTVPSCTCNGKDIFGTAAVSIRADFTLRPGDVVVMKDGVKVFVGTADGSRAAEDFVAAADYSGFSRRQRRQISEIEVSRRAVLESKLLDFNARFVFDPAPAKRN